jgi:hypothetical protein
VKNTPPSGEGPRQRSAKRTAEQVEIDRLKRENEKLARLVKSQEVVIDLLRRIHAFSEQFSESEDTAPPSRDPIMGEDDRVFGYTPGTVDELSGYVPGIGVVRWSEGRYDRWSPESGWFPVHLERPFNHQWSDGGTLVREVLDLGDRWMVAGANSFCISKDGKSAKPAGGCLGGLLRWNGQLWGQLIGDLTFIGLDLTEQYWRWTDAEPVSFSTEEELLRFSGGGGPMISFSEDIVRGHLSGDPSIQVKQNCYWSEVYFWRSLEWTERIPSFTGPFRTLEHECVYGPVETVGAVDYVELDDLVILYPSNNQYWPEYVPTLIVCDLNAQQHRNVELVGLHSNSLVGRIVAYQGSIIVADRNQVLRVDLQTGYCQPIWEALKPIEGLVLTDSGIVALLTNQGLLPDVTHLEI